MNRDLHVQEIYLNYLLSGEKTFEGRLGSEKNRLLKIGDTITFNNKYIYKITSIHIFSSYIDVFKILDFKKLMPNAQSVDHAVELYEDFYSKSKQKEFGVFVFGILPL